MRTYNDLYLWARHVLRDAGIEAYNLEARLLIAEAAKKTPEELIRDFRMYVDTPTDKRAEDFISRRAKGEPVAYITKEWEFLGIPIRVNENVLIPRTDTELLAEKAIELLRLRKDRENVRVLDLCSGSGCIGIAISSHLPGCRVTLADVSEEAIKVAKLNMSFNNVIRNVNCIEIDALKAPPRIMGRYDLIVSNPPYIPTADIETLDHSVKDYEPILALDGGKDGLDFYRSIIGAWKTVLKNRGVMMLECGIGQAQSVMALMKQAGFLNVCSIKDTGNVDRVVLGMVMTDDDER